MYLFCKLIFYSPTLNFEKYSFIFTTTALNLWQAKHDKRGLSSKPSISFSDRYARLGNHYENEASTSRVTQNPKQNMLHTPIVRSTGAPAHAKTFAITINPTESVPLYTETSLSATEAHTANSSVTTNPNYERPLEIAATNNY